MQLERKVAARVEGQVVDRPVGALATLQDASATAGEHADPGGGAGRQVARPDRKRPAPFQDAAELFRGEAVGARDPLVPGDGFDLRTRRRDGEPEGGSAGV